MLSNGTLSVNGLKPTTSGVCLSPFFQQKIYDIERKALF